MNERHYILVHSSDYYTCEPLLHQTDVTSTGCVVGLVLIMFKIVWWCEPNFGAGIAVTIRWWISFQHLEPKVCNDIFLVVVAIAASKTGWTITQCLKCICYNGWLY